MYGQRPPLRECNLFFFDSETGGFDATKHDMVEVAAIITDPTGKTVIEEYSAKVLPKRPVDPQAAAVNGYSSEKWAAEGIELSHAMAKMIAMARNARFVAHNAPFDWAFFEAAMKQNYQRWPGDYHRIDTVALAEPLLRHGFVDNVKLASLVQFFGVKHENAHTALADVRACREVYLKLMECYEPMVEFLKTARAAQGGVA